MEGVGRYALGVAALAVICSALALVAVAIRRRVLPDWDGAPARLAEAVIGLAALIAILELLGAVGLFAFVPVVLASIVVGFASRRRGASLRSASVGPSGPVLTRADVLLTGLAILAASAVIAEWGALTIQSYDVGIRGFDSLWYHLPWAASFAQTGNIVSLRFTDVEYLTAFYPATAEVLHGLGIVLLGRDTLSPGLNLLWLGLTFLAAYCIGRPRGVGAGTLLGAAVAMATSMMDYSQAGAAANDVVAVFFLLAAVAFLINDADRPAALILAAVAAGLAVGVKLTVLGPVVGLTIGVVAIAPRGERLRTTALWLGSADRRRRLLVRPQPDRGWQPAALEQPGRPADARSATTAEHRILGRALPDQRPLLERVRPARPRVGARRVVVGGARRCCDRPASVPAAESLGR